MSATARDVRVVRWLTAAGAVVAALLVLTLAVSLATDDSRRGAIIFGVIGVGALVAGLTVSSGAYAGGLVCIAAAFAFSLPGQESASAPIVGAAFLLLLVDQLVAWSLDAATGAIERGRDIARRGVRVLVVSITGAAVAGLVLYAGTLPVPGGLAAEMIGIAAALGVFALAAGRRWEH
jgi:hypothetical protein